MVTKNFFINRLAWFAIIGLIFSVTTSAQAASLSLKSSKSIVGVGELVTINLLVNADGQAINNASGQIDFPDDLFQLVSVDKSQSIFPLWVKGLSLFNLATIVGFEGGLPNPGFVGQSGEILRVILRAQKPGLAVLSVVNGSVRANDGLGTDVLRQTVGQTLRVIAPALTPAPVAPPKTASPPLPLVKMVTTLATNSPVVELATTSVVTDAPLTLSATATITTLIDSTLATWILILVAFLAFILGAIMAKL